MVIVEALLQACPFVAVAKFAPLERYALEFKGKSVHPARIGHVRHDFHAGGRQPLDELLDRGAVSESSVNDLLQHKADWLLSGAQGLLDLAFRGLALVGHHDPALGGALWPLRPDQVVGDLQALDDCCAFQILVLPKINAPIQADPALNDVDVLALGVVVQDDDKEVLLAEPQLFPEVGGDLAPLLGAERLALGQAQRAVPHGFFDVRPKLARDAELGGELAGVATVHVAADKLAVLQDVIEHAPEPLAPADPPHGLHG